VLDLPSEADTELKPKRTAPFGGVGESVRHLSYEDLEAYVGGRFPPARLDHCSAHLDSCLACRAELEDLRTLKSEASGFQRPAPLGRELERRRKRRTLTLVQTATVAVFSSQLLPRPSGGDVTDGRQKSPPSLRPSRRLRPRLLRPSQVPRRPRRSRLLSQRLPPEHRRPTRDLRCSVLLAKQLPNHALSFIGHRSPERSDTPLPLSMRDCIPCSTAALCGQQAGGLGAPLRRGRTYLWQVTATLRGGSTVVASGPSASGALLRISPK